jgi:hypothetical protein
MALPTNYLSDIHICATRPKNIRAVRTRIAQVRRIIARAGLSELAVNSLMVE